MSLVVVAIDPSPPSHPQDQAIWNIAKKLYIDEESGLLLELMATEQ